jgi:hypothetical protein
MKKFEYETLHMYEIENYDYLKHRLNEMGASGWELFSVTSEDKAIIFIFKREVV